MQKKASKLILFLSIVAIAILITKSNAKLAKATVSGTNISKENISTETVTANTVTSTSAVIDKVGIGSLSSDADFNISGGALAADIAYYFLKISGTLPSNATIQSPVSTYFSITSGGGNSTSQDAFAINLADGGLGATSQFSPALSVTDNVISSKAYSNATYSGKPAISVWTSGASTDNLGLYANAYGATGKNIGAFFRANTATAGTNVGISTAATYATTNITGFFGLAGTSASSLNTSAALIGDNGTAASPIFLARDNGSTTFSVEDDGHLKSTQTTAPTATLTSTTLNDGAGSGGAIALTNGSTDTAGSFIVTAGNGVPGAGIAGQIVFNQAYATAPKMVILTSKDVDGVDNQAYVSSIATTSFQISFNAALTALEAVEFYYLVIQ